MKQKLLNKLWLRVGMIVAIMTTALTGTAWAETYVWTTANGQLTTTTTSFTVNEVAWSFTPTWSNNTKTYVSWSGGSTNCYQIGSSKNIMTALSISTTGISGTISEVEVIWSSAAANAASLAVSVGGNSFTSTKASSNSSTLQTSTYSGTASGTLSMNFTCTTGIKLQKVTVTYTPSGSSAVATTTTINANGITNTNVHTSTEAGSLSATVKDASDNEVGGAEVTWKSSNEDVATIDEDGAVTLVAEGTTTITASYAGEDGVYNSSSDTYELTVIDEDPSLTTIWSEDFSDYAADDIPSGGTYSYVCANGGSTTKVYSQNSAGGTSPELLVSKSSGSFTAVIPLLYPAYAYSGNLTLTFKSNANNINVKTTTDGLAVSGEESSGAGVTFSTPDTHKVSFTGITNSTENITIVFTATSSSNVRLDDIVLKGKQAELPYVATPVITPTSGAVVSGQEVTISCATDGASIYYTTDGTDPSSSSTLYNPESKPTITAATTIKAIGIKDGLTNSTVAEASFTIAAPCATPTFSVAAGDVVKGTTVTIACATDGATIYYTTNGDEPTTSSSVYSDELTINATQTIKAIATKDGNANSAVASATYTIQDYATLPFAWVGGTKSALQEKSGVTASGLGSDYAEGNAPYRVKFDTDNDYIQVKTNAQPGRLYIGVKMLGGDNTSTITVQESADGTNFTDVEDLTISGASNAILSLESSNAFAADTRYVRLNFTKGSNVGVGPITITGCEAVTVGSAGYTTYVTTGKVEFPTGVTGYIATAINTSTVHLDEKASVPAATPIVIKAAEGSYKLPVITTTPESVEGNLLQASDGSVVTSNDSYYALAKKDDKVGFYQVDNGIVIPAGKAYLVDDAGVKGFTFDFDDDDATAIEKTLSDSPLKGENIYNLAGQRLGNSQLKRGIYIVNGKKVMVK